MCGCVCVCMYMQKGKEMMSTHTSRKPMYVLSSPTHRSYAVEQNTKLFWNVFGKFLEGASNLVGK